MQLSICHPRTSGHYYQNLPEKGLKLILADHRIQQFLKYVLLETI